MKPEELKLEIINTLIDVIPELDPDKLDPRINFRDQYAIDSIDYISFVMGLEKKLNTSIPESDYPKLSSLVGCLEYLSDSD
ncbi:acyl carrier protein [Pseudomonadota bacterium]